jgi:hypothetical protein
MAAQHWREAFLTGLANEKTGDARGECAYPLCQKRIFKPHSYATLMFLFTKDFLVGEGFERALHR